MKNQLHLIHRSNIRFEMKIILASFTFLLAVFSASNASSQDVIRLQQCSNLSIQQQADSMRQVYGRDGFQVIKETSMSMESEYEMPIVVPMQEGSWYQFVFIGDVSSRLYEVRMYDWDEKMVVYQKKMWGDVEGNIIAFSYIPKFSEFHMIKPVQQNKQKKKDLCGYVMLLKKVR